VISRYHGGAFVVFSKALHDNMQVVALEGSYASVIGGAPAAAVVFNHEVGALVEADPRLAELEALLGGADEPAAAKLRVERTELAEVVRAEKQGILAATYDGIHGVERACRVGSIDEIIPARSLRPYLVEAITRGVERALGRS